MGRARRSDRVRDTRVHAPGSRWRTAPDRPPRASSISTRLGYDQQDTGSLTAGRVIRDEGEQGLAEGERETRWGSGGRRGCGTVVGRPHQPCPSCPGPRCGPYVFRSMISAPMLQLESGVTSLSSPRLQPGSVRSGQLAVPTAQAINPPGSAWPKGRSMRCWSPAASASAETVGVLRPSNWFTPTPRVRHQAALPVVVDGASRTTGRHRSQPRRGQVALPSGGGGRWSSP